MLVRARQPLQHPRVFCPGELERLQLAEPPPAGGNTVRIVVWNVKVCLIAFCGSDIRLKNTSRLR